MKRRAGLRPLTQLATAMGSAARNIHDPVFRKIAEHNAARIPKCPAQYGTGKKAQMARQGRKLLARLTSLEADQLEDAAQQLRAYAGAITGRFDVTSEEIYRGRRSSRTG